MMLHFSFRLYGASTVLWSLGHILFTLKFWRFCYHCVSRKLILKKKKRMNWSKRNLWNINRSFLQCPRKSARYCTGMNSKTFQNWSRTLHINFWEKLFILFVNVTFNDAVNSTDYIALSDQLIMNWMWKIVAMAKFEVLM